VPLLISETAPGQGREPGPFLKGGTGAGAHPPLSSVLLVLAQRTIMGYPYNEVAYATAKQLEHFYAHL
jgi:hypothetical protein